MLDELRAALTRYWDGRSAALLLPGFGPGVTPVVAELRDHGAEVSVVITATAPAPDAPDVPLIWDLSENGDPLGRRAFERWLHEPGPEVAAWLDLVDPGRALTVLGNQYASTPAFCGRAMHGWRRPQWARWEDKVLVESLWYELDIPSPAHFIGTTEDAAVRSATRLDTGSGLVVARDSSRGFWGGARGLRLVSGQEQLDAALDALRGETELVRVARFVEGVPCSVIGLVLDRGVAVFDPIEIVTLRTDEGLVLCGTSTRWRPDAALAERIRACGRRVGKHLAGAAGLRGMFSLDGIATAAGFLATELNPRLSGGLGLAEALPALSENLLHRAAQERVPGVWNADPAGVEALVRGAIRTVPSHDVMITGPGDVMLPLEGIDPPREDGLIAPAAVRLAGTFGSGGVTSGSGSR